MKILIKLLPAVALIIFLYGCSAGLEMTSGWKENTVKIDGNSDEWAGSLKQIPDKNLAVGFKNDDQFLYMCLVINDPTKLMAMMHGGFFVWFEPENEKNTFGIKYPVPNLFSDKESMPMMDKSPDREKMQERIAKDFDKQKEMVIINSDNYPLGQFPVSNNKEGINAKIGFEGEGRFVYELQVPLAEKNNFVYKIDSRAGEKLNVRFETGEIERGKPGDDKGGMMRPEGGGGQMPPGGGGQMPGGRGMRGGMPGMRNAGDATINFSVELLLTGSN